MTLPSTRHLTIATAAALAAVAAAGCSSHRVTPQSPDGEAVQTVIAPPITDTGGSAMMPKALIYRTSAPADSLVPVTLSGGRLVSFPAPTDLTETSSPVPLTGGWLLDRRGISAATRFTRFTYSTYRSLPEAPSSVELLEAIVPGITVTEIVALPYAAGSVTPAQADSLIKEGLPGCKVIFKL